MRTLGVVALIVVAFHICAGAVAGAALAASPCATGFYGTDVNLCTACTNKPANSTYTRNAETNACPWACDSGYVSNGTSCDASTFSVTTTADVPMNSTTMQKLKVSYGDVTYSIHDDTINPE